MTELVISGFSMLLVTLIVAVIVEAKTFNREPEFIPMECTKYCYGTVTASGAKVREGIAAAKPEWIGLTAAVYLDTEKDGEHMPGKFVGYFEILDTGGGKIKDGTCIDLYDPDKESCVRWGRRNVWVVLKKGAG